MAYLFLFSVGIFFSYIIFTFLLVLIDSKNNDADDFSINFYHCAVLVEGFMVIPIIAVVDSCYRENVIVAVVTTKKLCKFSLSFFVQVAKIDIKFFWHVLFPFGFNQLYQ